MTIFEVLVIKYKMRRYCFLIFIAVISGCNGYRIKHPGSISEGPGLISRNGIVVSANSEASRIGAEILSKGGNAIDAAVATGFALAVCYPEAGNIGGGGFMLIRLADGTTEIIDYREKAPLGASRDMYLDGSDNVIVGSSTETRLASGVPGSVDGMIEAHKKYGRLPFKDIIQPAIDLAENGYIIGDGQANSFNSARKEFADRNVKMPALVKDSLWKEGDIVKQSELAATLRQIRDKGREGFYSGRVAEMIVSEMKRGNGLITIKDIESYRPVWRRPLVGKYHNYTVITAPPPSGGGIALLQMLMMVDKYKLNESGFHSISSMHLMIEAERRAFADRSFFAGDPDFVSIPVDKLISKEYISERMSSFNADKASLSTDIAHGEPEKKASEETTHYSVTDREGNAVSTTTTLNGTFGNCIFVDGSGFLLNNEMDDFSVKPGFPNMYGLTGGEANSIEPGKRMLSSMTPTIILRDGKLFLVTGSPGGSTIPTTVFQVVVNSVDFGMNIQEAVDAARFHHQWMPDLVYLENNSFDSVTARKLECLGHHLTTRSHIGSVNAIMMLDNGSFQGGADRRGNNSAASY